MRILVVILGRIGDMILSTPMFSAIKQKYPDSRIDILASIPNQIVIKHNPYIDNVYILDKSPFKLISLFRKLRTVNYDYLIDPKDHYSHESNLIAKFISAVNKIGFIKGRKSNFNISLPTGNFDRIKHLTGRYLEALRILDIDNNSIERPALFVDKSSEASIFKFLEITGNKKPVIFNISSGSPDRKWKALNWIKLINKANRDYFFPVLIYMNEERHDAEFIISNCEISAFQSSNFLEVISLVKHSSIIVTPDTSIVHIASAFNIPLIALYSGLKHNRERFAPLSDFVEIISARDNEKTLESILVDEVIGRFLFLQEKIKNP